VSDFRSSPFRGQGWDNVGAGFEGLYLLLAASLGVLGLICAVLVVLVLGRTFARIGVVGIAVCAAVLTNSIFEGWLLSGGSAYAWSVWILASVSGVPKRRLVRDRMATAS